MRSLRARSWDSYNNAKEWRFMTRTAVLQIVERVCEDCGGKGIDVGSLSEFVPEACPSCAGTGVLIPAERAERRGPRTAITALSNSSTVATLRTNVK